MQLDYWTNKAQIPTKGKKQRIYDMDALETVMLIKQGKDKGLNLSTAIEAASKFKEERSPRRALVGLARPRAGRRRPTPAPACSRSSPLRARGRRGPRAGDDLEVPMA
jgi:DNA-binding transcriptional MerR regulator